MCDMNQITLGLDPLPKKTLKEVFLDEMNHVTASHPQRPVRPGVLTM